jgi:hypothetical protein
MCKVEMLNKQGGSHRASPQPNRGSAQRYTSHVQAWWSWGHLEDDHVLVLQVVAQGLALQDGLELVQQVERVVGLRDVVEGGVDEALQPQRRLSVSCQ